MFDVREFFTSHAKLHSKVFCSKVNKYHVTHFLCCKAFGKTKSYYTQLQNYGGDGPVFGGLLCRYAKCIYDWRIGTAKS